MASVYLGTSVRERDEAHGRKEGKRARAIAGTSGKKLLRQAGRNAQGFGHLGHPVNNAADNTLKHIENSAPSIERTSAQHFSTFS